MSFKKGVFFFVFLVLLVGASVATYKFYGYIFSKTITGEIAGVERVTQPTAIMGDPTQIAPSQMYSFAVAIKDSKGEIHTASTEDRQWAVVNKGQCAEAKFFPYPPWELDKAGTYYGARLIRLFDCPLNGVGFDVAK